MTCESNYCLVKNIETYRIILAGPLAVLPSFMVYLYIKKQKKQKETYRIILAGPLAVVYGLLVYLKKKRLFVLDALHGYTAQ